VHLVEEPVVDFAASDYLEKTLSVASANSWKILSDLRDSRSGIEIVGFAVLRAAILTCGRIVKECAP